jgi:hypothetical protein
MQLHRESKRLESVGARLVVVGNGKPWFIAGFRDKSGYGGEVYTDPTLRSYQALRLRRGVGSSLSTRSFGKAIEAYRQGFRQTRTRGDAWQQGGVFVISAEGELVFSYASEHAGDHPPVSAIVQALATAARARRR